MESSAVVTAATLWRSLLTRKTRDDGSTYWCLNGSGTTADIAELTAAIYKAHDGKLPNDYSYQYVVDTLDDIIAYDGDADTARDELTADDYNSDLLAWLASHSGRVSFCDDALDEYGSDVSGIMALVALGQLKERTEVFEIVTRHVWEAADALPQVWTRENTELHTWFERDRAHVELRATESGETVIEWWDEDVQQAVEDGFLDPKDYHGSALDFARVQGRQP